MKTYWHIGKNTRGMSVILASLLMVVIVVALGGIVYAFASGMVTGLQGQAAGGAPPEELSLDTYTVSTADPANSANIYVRNIGGRPVTIVTAYVRDSATTLQLASNGTVPNAPFTVQPNTVSNVVVSPPILQMNLDAGREYTVLLVTNQGTQFVYTLRT